MVIFSWKEKKIGLRKADFEGKLAIKREFRHPYVPFYLF